MSDSYLQGSPLELVQKEVHQPTTVVEIAYHLPHAEDSKSICTVNIILKCLFTYLLIVFWQTLLPEDVIGHLF